MLISNAMNVTCIVSSPQLKCFLMERDVFLKIFKNVRKNVANGADIMQVLTTAIFKPKPNTEKLECVCLLSTSTNFIVTKYT